MAIGRISGPLLKSNLLRNGVDLAFETDLLYLDVTNRRIGVKTTSPQYALDVQGVARVTDLEITNNTFQVGNVTLDGSTGTISTSAQEFSIATADNTIVGNRVLVGDLEIKPSGSIGVMQKEIRSQRLTALLQTVANPMLAPFIKLPNLMKELAIAQDIDTGEVLMQAFVDRNAVNETLQTGYVALTAEEL